VRNREYLNQATENDKKTLRKLPLLYIFLLLQELVEAEASGGAAVEQVARVLETLGFLEKF